MRAQFGAPSFLEYGESRADFFHGIHHPSLFSGK